ncbi:hypothetical protein CROQUDRAFT_133590 [Cronartium quercuum f. sp. fusiforme G11]|uniref:Uncharacterized protein n=1 Tax=Cronartium quercuum f. sp. fusiforme G11 TaxID=708437 RepID=A0A9P6TAY5_9BASI|nr:hypothetical protein CROQUDRAFT_133590 [Cronartium quercuum f. sp. fusiforme G11]
MASTTNTPSIALQGSISAINKLHGFTNSLVESHRANEDIESSRTIGFKHDLGSVIAQPLTPNLIAASGVSSGPAIKSDYLPLDNMEITDQFVAANIELASIYSGFIDNKVQPPNSVVWEKNRGTKQLSCIVLLQEY